MVSEALGHGATRRQPRARGAALTFVMTVWPSFWATKSLTLLAGALASLLPPMKWSARLCFWAYDGLPLATGTVRPFVTASAMFVKGRGRAGGGARGDSGAARQPSSRHGPSAEEANASRAVCATANGEEAETDAGVARSKHGQPHRGTERAGEKERTKTTPRAVLEGAEGEALRVEGAGEREGGGAGGGAWASRGGAGEECEKLKALLLLRLRLAAAALAPPMWCLYEDGASSAREASWSGASSSSKLRRGTPTVGGGGRDESARKQAIPC